MQIRLTVLAPHSGRSVSEARSCDVLVTAPAGAVLAAVASGLATAVAGPDGQGSGGQGSGGVVLYAGRRRLDPQRCALGEPPLVDGAVLSLQVPVDEEEPGEAAAAELHVVAGPDAGGVHLLHGGRIRIGRSGEADVPLDDPDVSRMHCMVTVADDGRVTVADLGSTNGTTLDGAEVGERPVRITPGSLLRIGESALRITSAGSAADSGVVAAVPDGEGHLRVVRGGTAPDGTAGAGPGPDGRTPGTAPPSGGPARGAASVAAVPRAGSPRTASPQAGSPRDGSPRAASARAGSPQAGSPRAGNPRTGSPRAEDPQAGSARAGSPQAGPPPAGYPQAEYPEAGHPRTGNPRTGSRRAEDPRTASPQAGSARAGDPQAGSARAGFPQQGASQPRAPQPADRQPADRQIVQRGPGGHPGHGGDTAGEGRIPVQPGPAGRTPGSRRVSARGDETARDPYSKLYEEAAAAYAQDQGFAARGRQGTPARGIRVPADDEQAGGPQVDGDAETVRRRVGLGAWARRLTGGRPDPLPAGVPAQATGPDRAGSPGPAAQPSTPDTWPDPASLLLTALGPGSRLWERGPGHRETLVVRLGTADRSGPGNIGVLPAVPVTVSLREAGSLGLAGPRERLYGLARSVVAQLAALHSPADLEIVLISSDRARSVEARRADWSWLGWLPHLRPGHGQDCRLLLSYDRDQATARTAELVRRLDAGPLGAGWASAGPAEVSEAAERHPGPYTVVIVDGDPGSASLRETTARLASAGAAGGIHLLCLAETPPASPASPLTATYETACAISLAFRECGAAALLSGDVATTLRLLRTAGGQSAGRGTPAVVDAVSAAWAERFGRALAPLRAEASAGGTAARQAAALPLSARLLDELGLARATPASLMARWASAAEATAVLGAGPHGPVTVDLATEGPHLLIEGPAGSGRTELLRAAAASLAAAARPDRLALILVDGAGGERGDGLRACTELPHTSTHLVASDPVRMRAFAQALGAELKRRSELVGRSDFTEWHRHHDEAARRGGRRPAGPDDRLGELDSPSGTLRLRPATALAATVPGPTPLPRLVVLVDDFDALVAPALGSPGRPAAGSVVRALEAVVREGERLGVHLIAASARPDRTEDTELARVSRLRVILDAPPVSPAPDTPSPGRGRLGRPDSGVSPFQGGRVTGRIPRTGTLRPTVVPLEWERMGDPPTRRPVRELGNGPTDLALLASALERAARSVDATPVAALID